MLITGSDFAVEHILILLAGVIKIHDLGKGDKK